MTWLSIASERSASTIRSLPSCPARRARKLARGRFGREAEPVGAAPSGLDCAFELRRGGAEGWRERGARFRSRISSVAPSATAGLVLLGDEHAAEPGPTLWRHCAHLSSASELDARTTATIHGAQREVDELMNTRLAARRGPARGDEVAHESEPHDREALELLGTESDRAGEDESIPGRE